MGKVTHSVIYQHYESFEAVKVLSFLRSLHCFFWHCWVRMLPLLLSLLFCPHFFMFLWTQSCYAKSPCFVLAGALQLWCRISPYFSLPLVLTSTSVSCSQFLTVLVGFKLTYSWLHILPNSSRWSFKPALLPTSLSSGDSEGLFLSCGCGCMAGSDKDPVLHGHQHGLAWITAGDCTSKLSWLPPPSLFWPSPSSVFIHSSIKETYLSGNGLLSHTTDQLISFQQFLCYVTVLVTWFSLIIELPLQKEPPPKLINKSPTDTPEQTQKPAVKKQIL